MPARKSSSSRITTKSSMVSWEHASVQSKLMVALQALSANSTGVLPLAHHTWTDPDRAYFMSQVTEQFVEPVAEVT